jgi:uncharacterized SAM-binding protein YcdF (DUF218 family)
VGRPFYLARRTATLPWQSRLWRCAAVMFVLASVAAGGWLTREPLLREAADLWIVLDPISRGDAIVVLGGGLATRPFEAAELWHRGLADKILISQVSEERAVRIGAMRGKSGIFATCGRDPRPRWVSSRRRLEWPNGAMCVFFSGEEPESLRGPEAEMPSHNELNREILLKLGVPATAIETFGTANKNTRDEAVALREWAERNTTSAFIIPTEFFSARRVRWIFRREFFRTAVKIEVLSLEHPDFTRQDWWKTEHGVIAFQNEVFKYIYYRWKY